MRLNKTHVQCSLSGIAKIGSVEFCIRGERLKTIIETGKVNLASEMNYFKRCEQLKDFTHIYAYSHIYTHTHKNTLRPWCDKLGVY